MTGNHVRIFSNFDTDYQYNSAPIAVQKNQLYKEMQTLKILLYDLGQLISKTNYRQLAIFHFLTKFKF